jgi:putative phosphoribosyl transferase
MVTGSRDSGPGPAAPGQSVAVGIEVGELRLPGDLTLPADAKGIVVFAHGSGSSRQSPRNRFVARALNEHGFATLLFDLLTQQEELNRANVFDVELLGGRLAEATVWLQSGPLAGQLPVGYFGASTGAAAALWAAAELGARIRAVLSRGGRPDLAKPRLAEVTAPTLLIVGGRDPVVIQLNREAQAHLRCENRLEIVPGATHLFEEPGALERVIELALGWFDAHLTAVPGVGTSGPDAR